MENKIIICEKCFEENDISNKTCKSCGSELYKFDIEQNISSSSKQERKKNVPKYENNKKDTYKHTNNVAKIIKILAIFIGICGFILCLSLIESLEVFAIVYILLGIILAIFIYALGEIIQLLEDIKRK